MPLGLAESEKRKDMEPLIISVDGPGQVFIYTRTANEIKPFLAEGSDMNRHKTATTNDRGIALM